MPGSKRGMAEHLAASIYGLCQIACLGKGGLRLIARKNIEKKSKIALLVSMGGPAGVLNVTPARVWRLRQNRVMSQISSPEASPFLSLASVVAKPGQGVPSPCVGVCRLDEASGLCLGCWRTRDELRAWKSSDDAARREVWALVEQRQRAAGVQPA